MKTSQQKNKIIEEWFHSWYESNWNRFDEIFEFEVYYSESWGPMYQGIKEMMIWKDEWHQHAFLNEWRIDKIYHLDTISFVEWYFDCCDNGKQHVFHGISVIEWSDNDKILSLKEYASSLPQYNPIKNEKISIEAKFPYDCPIIYEKDFEDSSFQVVCSFPKDCLLKNEEKKELFQTIRQQCHGERLWALLGGMKRDEYICLQVGHSSSVAKEITSDLQCMLPFDETKDVKSWSSQFHQSLFQVKYGFDVRCQKYNDMYNRFAYFCLILIECNDYLKNVETKQYDLIQFAEVKFAFDTKALYWNPNPFNQEKAILNEFDISFLK